MVVRISRAPGQIAMIKYFAEYFGGGSSNPESADGKETISQVRFTRVALTMQVADCSWVPQSAIKSAERTVERNDAAYEQKKATGY